MSPLGSGKYDKLCNEVLQKSGGRAAVVIVVERAPDKGSTMAVREEFSVAGGEYHVKILPKVLRRIADEIERSAGLEHD